VEQNIRLYAAVAAGSALGAVARHLCSTALVAALGAGFPWGTLAVNVLGSFLIGLYAVPTEPEGRLLASPAMRQFVLAGFCGGFTTFSIFSLETLLLLESGHPALAGVNVVLSLCLWLPAVWLGHLIGLRRNRTKSTG
jgi:CrcB protein